MAEARIEVTCPGCEKPFLVGSAEQGKIADCPRCHGWVDVPDLSRPPTPAELGDVMDGLAQTEHERQLTENARLLEQSRRAMDKRDRQDARFDVLLDRLEAVIGRWEQLAGRAGIVIERLEGR